jgi:hypothetical protein
MFQNTLKKTWWCGLHNGTGSLVRAEENICLKKDIGEYE